MDKYIVMPINGISYVVYADMVEADGEWLMFYKKSESDHRVWDFIHACSSHSTQRAGRVKEE